ncbi:MAG: efflux RND transporter permease subunit [Bacteroidota bacterium]
MKLSTTAIKRPAATIILMTAIAVVGILGYSQLPTNLLPDITYPLVKVYVTWRGSTPEEIEDNIASVVERKMSTVDDLDYLESQSTEGLYSLMVNFDYSADRDIAYQDVLAKMGLVRSQLPRDAEEPLIIKADPSQLPVMDLLIMSENMNLVKLRTWVQNYLQDQFVSVSGTAGTDVSGGLKREIRVHLHPEKLQGHGITVDRVLQRLRDENVELLGGRVTSERKDFIARTVGEFQRVSDINDVILQTNKTGSTVTLKDVATVSDAYAVQRIKTKLGETEGVKLSIFKQASANTVEVSDLVQERLKELQHVLPPDVKMELIYDQAEYIRASVSGVRDAALIAALLVVFVTAFFLTGWRRVLIIALTLPVTLLGTFFFMKLLGYSINILSLGGLVVAITVLLDNAVVVLENITRLQTEEPDERTPVQTGATQVSGAVLTATFTFIALFLPFLLIPGLVSLLFQELIITVAITIALSLLVALTVTPSLTALLFPEGKSVSAKPGLINRLADGTMRLMTSAYRPMLAWSLRFRWIVMGIVLVLFGVGVFFLLSLGTEFLPPADDGLITVKLKMPTGASVEQTDRVVTQVAEIVQSQPYIDRYSTLSGAKVIGLVTYELANEGEVNIQLVRPAKRPLTTDEYVSMLGPVIQQQVKAPGAKVKVFHAKLKGLRSVGEFDIEVELLAPRSEPMERLYETVSAVAGRLRQIPALTNIDVSIDITKPEYQVIVDRRRAMDLGLSVNQIATTVKSMVDGAVPTWYKEEGYYYPIRAVLNERDVTSKKDIEDLVLFSPSGGMVFLRDVASVVQASGPLEIDRKDQARMIKATATVAGGSVGEATAKVQQTLVDYPFSPGYTVHYGGQSQMLAENMTAMILILVIAMFFAYVVLVVNFEDFIKPFMILISVPLSLIGVSLALWLTNQAIGVTVMIGFIILAGIEVNQGVILITFIDELRRKGLGLQEAIVKAATVRLRPILMTDVVGIFGLLPLALSIGEGTELLKPMAIAVIGGLIVGLLLVILFMPALYLIFEQHKTQQYTKEQIS